MLGLMKDEVKTYLSSNFLCETELPDCFEKLVYSLDVLNGFKSSRIFNRKLTLKTCVLVMLLHNIDQTKIHAMVLDYRLLDLEDMSLKPESHLIDFLTRLLIYLI